MTLIFRCLQRRYGQVFSAFALIAVMAGLSSCTQVKVANPKTNLELAPAPYFDERTGIYFPGALGNLFRRPVVELEERSPGLGLAVSYRNEDARIDVFVYDLQASIIPTGTDSEVIQKSFADAISDLRLAHAKHIYNALDISPEREIQIANTPFLHASFTYSESITPKEGELYVSGVNSQILKIRAAKRVGSSIDFDRLLSYLGYAIEQSHRNGFGGVSTSDYKAISQQAARIDLSDGLSEAEAICIAQIELVEEKNHHRFDVASAQLSPNQNSTSYAIEFSPYPSTPRRLEETPLLIAVDPLGRAQIISN